MLPAPGQSCHLPHQCGDNAQAHGTSCPGCGTHGRIRHQPLVCRHRHQKTRTIDAGTLTSISWQTHREQALDRLEPQVCNLASQQQAQTLGMPTVGRASQTRAGTAASCKACCSWAAPGAIALTRELSATKIRVQGQMCKQHGMASRQGVRTHGIPNSSPRSAAASHACACDSWLLGKQLS